MHVSAKLHEQNRLQAHRLEKSFTLRCLHVTERWKLCMKAANLGRARAGCVLRICNFGSSLVSYGEGLHLQQQLAQLCKERAIVDTVLLLQHAPVYTIGKRGSNKDFLTAPEQLRAEGAEIYTSDRGGEVTFHGPGQVVMYPVVNLRRLGVGARVFVEGLEDAMVRTAGARGVSARGRVPARTGVWVGERKLGAVGVRISHGVATHGVALNVATDLRRFAPIVACGLADAVATSLQQELGAAAFPGGSHPVLLDDLGRALGSGSARSPGEAVAPRALLTVPRRAGSAHDRDEGGLGVCAAGDGSSSMGSSSGASMVEAVAVQLADAFAARFDYGQREHIEPSELQHLLQTRNEPVGA